MSKCWVSKCYPEMNNRCLGSWPVASGCCNNSSQIPIIVQKAKKLEEEEGETFEELWFLDQEEIYYVLRELNELMRIDNMNNDIKRNHFPCRLKPSIFSARKYESCRMRCDISKDCAVTWRKEERCVIYVSAALMVD